MQSLRIVARRALAKQVSFLPEHALRCISTTATTSTTSQDWRWGNGAFAVAATVAVSAAALTGFASCEEAEKDSPTMFLDKTMRQSFFFMYEKRLRQFSQPEKVFEYFSSVTTPGGAKAMMPSDLMRASVPVFSPMGSDNIKQGHLGGESSEGLWNTKGTKTSKFFQLFDIDGDGTIDFPEYVFFTTLLSIPVHDVRIAFMMFDTDDSGTLDRDEFKRVLANLREKTRVGKSTGKRPGMKMKGVGSVEDGGLVEYFFGKNGKKMLTLKKFEEFLMQLHIEMVALEFSHYDYLNTGYLSYKDFALSLVASGNVSEIRQYLSRVASLPPMPGKGVTLAQFQEVYKLRPRLHDMHVALMSYGGAGGVEKEDFKRAARKIGGVHITDTQIDVLYYVFDLDQNGTLDADEFVNIISSKLPTASGPAFGLDTSSVFGCCKSCWDNRAIMEDAVKEA